MDIKIDKIIINEHEHKIRAITPAKNMYVLKFNKGENWIRFKFIAAVARLMIERKKEYNDSRVPASELFKSLSIATEDYEEKIENAKQNNKYF